MPIITGNRPIFRVKLKDVDIREIRRADELSGGLYEIKYINNGPKDIPLGYESTTNIPTYVGGYPNQTSADKYIRKYETGSGLDKKNFYIHIPEDATAEEAKAKLGSNYGYKSHAEGWFDSNECDDFNYIPAITRDFYKDLTLFCKGKQRRYLYNGVGKYYKTDSVLVDGVGVPD